MREAISDKKINPLADLWNSRDNIIPPKPREPRAGRTGNGLTYECGALGGAKKMKDVLLAIAILIGIGGGIGALATLITLLLNRLFGGAWVDYSNPEEPQGWWE